MSATQAVLLGLAALALFWFTVGAATKWNPMQLIMGEDGALSTSKFQFLLWTAVVVFSYVTLFAFQAHADHFAPFASIPTNLLFAMGISAGTAVGAKAIAVNSAASAAPPAEIAAVAAAIPIAVPPQAVAAVAVIAPKLGGLLVDDDGTADLSKIQLVMWTVIGIVSYLTQVGHYLRSDIRQLPDIDRALMILMGLGHSAYLGKKIADA